MTKVEAVLPEALRRVVLETPLFAPELPGASAVAGELALLRRAISERRFVHFRYAREDGAESERDARPLGLYFWGRKWTLAAWCELRRDYRSFRPDRMRDVRAARARASTRADGISLAGFMAKKRPRRLGDLGVARAARGRRAVDGSNGALTLAGRAPRAIASASLPGTPRPRSTSAATADACPSRAPSSRTRRIAASTEPCTRSAAACSLA